MGRASVPREGLVAQLRALGVRGGGVRLVHTSFRAVRPVERGPAGLVDALRDAIGPRGTLVMPAWSDDDHHPLDPASTPASPDLGVVAVARERLARECLARDPLLFLHDPGEGCEECDDARAGVGR